MPNHGFKPLLEIEISRYVTIQNKGYFVGYSLKMRKWYKKMLFKQVSFKETFSRFFRSYHLLYLIALTIINFIIRMYLQTFSTLIFSDEARLAVLARNFVYGKPISLLGGSKTTFIEHPLFIMILSFSFLLFGINDLAARMFPIFFGSILVFPTHFLAEKTFNRRIGILSATLVSFHWYLIRNSILVSSRIPFVFFLLTTMYLTIRLIDEKNSRVGLLAGFSCGVAGLIRGEGFFLLIPLLIYIVVLEGNVSILKSRLLWLPIIGFFLCTTPLFVRNALILGNPLGRSPDEGDVFLWVLKFNILLIQQITTFSMLPFPLLAVCGIIGFLVSINQWKRCLHLYLVIGFFYFVFSSPMIFGTRVVLPYILPVLPLILIFASVGIISILDKENINSLFGKLIEFWKRFEYFSIIIFCVSILSLRIISKLIVNLLLVLKIYTIPIQFDQMWLAEYSFVYNLRVYTLMLPFIIIFGFLFGFTITYFQWKKKSQIVSLNTILRSIGYSIIGSTLGDCFYVILFYSIPASSIFYGVARELGPSFYPYILQEYARELTLLLILLTPVFLLLSIPVALGSCITYYFIKKHLTQIRAFHDFISNIFVHAQRLVAQIRARIHRIPIMKIFLIAFLLMILFFSTDSIIVNSIEYPSTSYPIGYRITGEWVEENTPPDTIIMAWREAIGWYANRTFFYFSGNNYSHMISLCKAWNVHYLVYTEDSENRHPFLSSLSDENNAPKNLKSVYTYITPHGRLDNSKIIVYKILYYN